MSEVKRWKLKGFIPGVDGESKAIFQPVVVLAEDFDNVTRLFLDAAEQAVASERREKELQQRLAEADERADVLEVALNKIKARLDAYAEADMRMPEASIEVCQMIAGAALKPAEPDRIKGMIEAAGGEYAIMIDPENGHFGWTFNRHPDGQWVSGRKATEPEMHAARQCAVARGQNV